MLSWTPKPNISKDCTYTFSWKNAVGCFVEQNKVKDFFSDDGLQRQYYNPLHKVKQASHFFFKDPTTAWKYFLV